MASLDDETIIHVWETIRRHPHFDDDIAQSVVEILLKRAEPPRDVMQYAFKVAYRLKDQARKKEVPIGLPRL